MPIKSIVILFFSAFTIQGQTQGILDQIVWADDLGGNWNSISNPEIETDEEDNIIFGVTYLGYQDNYLEWRGDTIFKEANLLGKRIIFLAKLDQDGNLLWHLVLKGDPGVYMQELKVDHDNNIILLLKNSGEFEAFQQSFEIGFHLIKLDQNGNFLWSDHIINADIFNPGHSLSIACDNDIILGGSIGKVPYDSVVYEVTDWDTIFEYLYKYDTLFLDGQGFTADTHNIFLARFNSDGHLRWLKTFEHKGGLALNAIDASTPHGIALLGFYLHEDWPIFNSVLPIDTNGYIHKYNMFIMTLDDEGQIKWVYKYFNNATPAHITYDYDGNLIILGDFPPSSSTYYQLDTIEEVNNSGNLLFFKIDSSGNYLWGKNTGGYNTTSGGSMLTNSSGDIYLTGRGLSNLLGVMLNKYDGQGKPVWTIFPPTNSNRRGEDISLDRSGHLILAGYYSGKLTLGNYIFEHYGAAYCNLIVKFKSEPGANTPSACEVLSSTETVQSRKSVINLSPNPASNRIQIDAAPMFTSSTLIVYNSQGNWVYGAKLLESLPISLDISGWAAGMYVVRIQSQQSVLINSFVVIH